MSEVVDYNSFELNRVPQIPAPWNLTGRGLILLLKGFRIAMVVDYTTSDCGPYQELLYIPGRERFLGQKRFTISDIYVSSMASVINGRHNWGIPKKLAQFDRTDNGLQSTVRVGQSDSPFFEVSYQAFGPQLPLATAYLPGMFTRLGQQSELGTFLYSPLAQGKMRLARIRQLSSTQAEFFPSLSAKDVLMAFAADPFAMVFPVSQHLKT